MKVSRTSILFAIVAVVLLSVLPGSIRRTMQSGDLYLFTSQFFHDMLARLTGPGKLRFIIQPTVAIILGARHGVKDAYTHLPPFLEMVSFHAKHRRHAIRSAVADVRDLIAIAILLDLIAQELIFHNIHPGASLILGPVLIAIPYGLARDFANRLVRARRRTTQARGKPSIEFQSRRNCFGPN
jgi:hypothetical protein